MMMPSRGLVSAAGAARQAARLNRRFISTTPSRKIHTPSRLSSSGLIQNTQSWRVSRVGPAAGVLLAAQSRLASTTAPVTATGAATGADATVVSPPGPLDAAATDLSSNFDISTVTDSYIAAIPGQIGYLKEIGLDYGWGPTAMIEWGLEHIHVYTGLPWWASIIATAVAFRLTLLPLFKKSSDVGARQSAMMPIIKPLNAKMMEAFKANDMETGSRLRAELKGIYARSGISTTALLTPALLQGVFGFCAFKLHRAMANLPVPGLEDGGILWFTDLTQRDPYLLLPAIMAISMHTVFRFGGESGAPMQNPAMKPLMLYAMPGLIFFSTLWMPANLDLWLATTGVTGIGQVILFRQPWVRNALGMAPLVPTDPRFPGGPAGGAGGSSNTIDVKATSRPTAAPQQAQSGAGIRYQAPNIKTTAAPVVDTSSASAVASEQKDFVSRKLEGITSTINSSADGIKKMWDEGKATASSYAGRNNQVESKTRSKEFLKQAEAYEKKWQKLNKGRKN